MMTIAMAMAMGVAATASAEPKGAASMDGEAPAEEAQPPAAEEMPPPAPVYTPPMDTGIVPVSTPTRWAPRSNIGMAVMGGGGVTNFTGDTASNATGVGGSWDVRFAVATRRWVGFEASYIGGSNGINNLLAVNDNNSARLNRNGLEGALRINAPLYAKNTLLSPYILGGVGWNAYRVSNYNAVTSSVSLSASTDNTLSVPVATGFAVGYKGFIADVRYTFRPTFEQQIFLNGSNSTLTNWDAGAMLGYEF
jgi:hypothetical protein